jgi:hypothetical protein
MAVDLDSVALWMDAVHVTTPRPQLLNPRDRGRGKVGNRYLRAHGGYR